MSDLISRQAAIDACHNWDDGKDAYAFGHVIVERIQKLPSAQRWIPVSERLPELRTKVLCCGERGGRFIAELAVSVFGPKNSVYWDRKNGKLCSKVTHWMPLPEKPKEVE